MSRSLHQRPDRRRGFTLVELLMAIAIIGVLVALTWRVNAARTAILKRAIALEGHAGPGDRGLQAVRQYPPDGSSRAAFEAHFRSVFPNIAASELALLVAPITTSHSPAGVMDPAEALVFCLGGFSNDPQYPFTGNGGPIVLTNNGDLVKSNMFNNQTIVQYNTDRNEGFFPFGQDRLTLDSSSGVTVSNDELLFGTLNAAGNPIAPDVLPAYLPRSRTAPLVYFSAATYSFSTGGSIFFNFYGGRHVRVTRPYKSDQVNTAVTHSATTGDRFYRYMNEVFSDHLSRIG